MFSRTKMEILATVLAFVLIFSNNDIEGATSTESTPPTLSPESEYGDLGNISVRDILSTQINGNEEIIKKIISSVPEFASNYDSYKAIKLSVDGFSFPPKFVEVGLSDYNALFHNISATQWFDGGDKNQRFVTSVGCNLPGSAKVHVSLPNNVQIKTNLIIYSLTQENDIMAEGLISYTMKNGALLKQSMIKSNESNSETGITQQIFYNRSSIDLEIDTQNHQLLYNHINSFVSKIESLLGDHLLKQLDEELTKRNATIVSSCSKLLKSKHPEKTVTDSPLFSKFALLSNLYVASGVKSQKIASISLCLAQSFKPQFGRITTLNPGPVVVEGLSDFVNVEATFSYLDNLQKRKDYDKTMIVRIKSAPLRGKFEWDYGVKGNDTETGRNMKFLFTVLSSQIEIKVNRYCRDSSCNKYLVQDPELNVHLKKIRIDTSLQDTYCIHEGKMMLDVLSEYAELAIGESLKDSITRKITENRALYVNTFNA